MSRPRDATLRWAARSLSPRASVVSAVGLRDGGSPWLLEIEDAALVRVILKTGDLGQREELATEGAALSLAESSGLPAPRLIAADLDGNEAGGFALLFTMLEGSADIPVESSSQRLRVAGAAAASIHGVSMQPSEQLPARKRHMPWIDFSAMRRAGDQGEESTPLLDEADALAHNLPEPSGGTVFVHGDLWQGNLMWSGERFSGIIDWEAAGAGSYGVDLGSLRLDVALLYGLDAVDEVLAGWEETSGRAAEDVPYWDLVAALNTRADMSGFLPTMHEAGRTDLDGPTLTRRRDEFLQSALDRLMAP